MTELISDKQKYRKLEEDPTLQRERVLQQTSPQINKENGFSVIEYSKPA